jgi:hypothetical protein
MELSELISILDTAFQSNTPAIQNALAGLSSMCKLEQPDASTMGPVESMFSNFKI